MCEGDTKFKTDQLVIAPLRNGYETIGRVYAVILPGTMYDGARLKEPVYKVHFIRWIRDYKESDLRSYEE